MNWILSLLITIFLITLGFIYRKNKFVWFLQFIWMWILMAGSNGGVDWTVHKDIFTKYSLNFKILDESWLYKMFCYPFVINGYTFYQFNFVISTILLLVLFHLIKKYSKNVCFVTSLIYIYPLADSIIQKRNFCALVIFLCGIFPLIYKEKRGDIKFILCTFLAAQVHMSYYLYFIIYPLIKLENKYLNKVIKNAVFLAFLCTPFIPQIASLFVNSEKVKFYFLELKIPFYQSCCWWGVQMIFTYLFAKINNIKNTINENLNIKTENYNENALKLNKIMLVFMPLYYYEPTFFRFFRNIIFVNYVEASSIFDNKNTIYKNEFIIMFILVLFVILMFLSQFVFFGKGFEYLCIPIFQANSFLGRN